MGIAVLPNPGASEQLDACQIGYNLKPHMGWIQIGNYRGKFIQRSDVLQAQARFKLTAAKRSSVWHLTHDDLERLKPAPHVTHNPLFPWMTDQQPSRVTKPSKALNKQDCEAHPSFIEEKMVFLEEGMQNIGAILNPVFNVVLQPFIDQFLEIAGEQVREEFGEDISHNMEGEIPRLVVGHVTNALARNVSNLLTDSLTESITKRLVVPI